MILARKWGVMLTIDRLQLPKVLPHPNAIKSWGENEHSYDPEFWEFQYQVYRYLGRISNNELASRYDSIVRNIEAIVSDDRHVIPIFSFISSWYWYRKEHQTRHEFALRKIPLNRGLPVLSKKDLRAGPARPRSPNAGDVLFRYGSKKWLQDFVQFGTIRISAAREYALLERDAARQDDELVKSSFMPGAYTKITTEDGQDLGILGDLKESVSGADYFVYCMSCDWDVGLFDDFNSDCCVVIKRPDEFARRLETAAKSQLDGWYFLRSPVEYFDPYERKAKQRIDNAMSKDFRFAYQREYRFLWASFKGLIATGFISLDLGPLDDIAELHMRPAR